MFISRMPSTSLYKVTKFNSRKRKMLQPNPGLFFLCRCVKLVCVNGRHNLLGRISLNCFAALLSWTGFVNFCLSAINLAKRDPFPSLFSSSSSACGRFGKGGGFGDSGGINAHTEERCLFVWSRTCSNERSCISVGQKKNP